MFDGGKNPSGYLCGGTTALDYGIGDIPDRMRDHFLGDTCYPEKSFTAGI